MWKTIAFCTLKALNKHVNNLHSPNKYKNSFFKGKSTTNLMIWWTS